MMNEMNAIVIGPDADGLGDALDAIGVSVSHAAGTASRDLLIDAGIETADLLAVTDAALATSIPIAREVNPDIRVVVYAHDTVPEFARPTAGLILDPDLMNTKTVAEEITQIGK
jgi:voltage-gated potassium channel Kch